MHLARREDVAVPLSSPSGELIFELVGAASDAGGTKRHSLAIVVIPPGKSSARHYHLVSDETYFILQGTARMAVDDSEFRLEHGQACLIRPPERHQIWNAGDEDLEFIAVCAPAWVPEDSIFELW